MRIITSLVFTLMLSTAFGQNINRCGTDEAVQHRESEFPGFSAAVERTFQDAKNHSQLKDTQDNDTIYRIPVVVHIVYNSPDENVSDDLVHSQIARLNRDYRRLNENAEDTRSEFLPVAADAKIEFYLAGVDPNGNSTGGITRTQTTRADFAPDFFGNGMDDVKQSAEGGVDSWDTENYLNIWVCDLIESNSLFAILGFAYPPASAPNWPSGSAAPSAAYEGVVIHYEVFGDGNPLAVGEMAVSDRGRTAVHETGHYLGLRHIWGDALFTDGCAEDDGIDDTPNASANAQQQCNFSNNTCFDTPIDFPDMIENYMDYAQDQCMNLFTQGQVDIMRSMLETARASLVDDSVAPSGIQEAGIDGNSITVFPNPSNGVFQLQFPSELHALNYSIFDCQGKLMETSNLNSSPLQTLTVQLASGLYLLEVAFEEGVVVKRLSVQ